MADRSKFEEMLELLVNEDREAAQELFHEIVVEKSRDIYESLLEDEEEVDESDEDLDEADDDDLDESDDEDLDESDDEDLDESDEELDEYFDLDEFEVEADDDMIGGDETDDMMADLGMDDDEGDMDMDMDDMGDEGGDDLEGRVDDIEDALDSLQADLERMLAGDDDDMDDMDDEGEEDEEDDEDEMDFDMDSDDDEDKKESMSAAEEMREYVEKIGGDRYDAFGKMGDNGVQTKSPVAGKNDMGGTTQNILRGDTAETGEANKGALKGSPVSDTSPKDMNTKNINVPGGKASKAQKKQSGGGLDNNSILKKDSTDSSAKSPLNGVKTRAK